MEVYRRRLVCVGAGGCQLSDRLARTEALTMGSEGASAWRVILGVRSVVAAERATAAGRAARCL